MKYQKQFVSKNDVLYTINNVHGSFVCQLIISLWSIETFMFSYKFLKIDQRANKNINSTQKLTFFQYVLISDV